MPTYPNEHLADMHYLYGFCNGNARAAQREYGQRFRGRPLPSPSTFSRIHRNLRERGTFLRARREPGRIEDVDEDILDNVRRDPETSIRTVAIRFDVSPWKVWDVLRQEGLHPYHFLRVQGLEGTDSQQRINFCKWLLYNDVEDPQFFRRILWTDESTFTREGGFNVHNRHYYAAENPRLIRQQRFQRRFKINVWIGCIGNLIVGPLFDLPTTLGGNDYLRFLQHNLPTLLEDVPLNIRQRMIFQHDGAPPHFTRTVREHLNSTYPEWIGRGGRIPWPPRSPDLNPIDFFVWGFLKSLVYSQEVHTVEE